MWRVAVASGVIAFCALWYANYLAERLATVQQQLEQSQREVRTHERIRGADVGRGDPDDDAKWLCARAGRGDCGP